MKKTLKAAALFLSFAYLSIYLPVAGVLYSSGWYRLHCGFNHRCVAAGEERTSLGILELVGYFRHMKEGLDAPFWTEKEKSHLAEVRSMTDKLTLACLPLLVLGLLTFDADRMRTFCLVNIALMASLILILPFFAYFWHSVFHPLLFSNNNWINTPRDFSFYILPRVFFRNTLILMILATIVIDLVAYLLITLRIKRTVTIHA
jgi:uncharacterized membrane protein